MATDKIIPSLTLPKREGEYGYRTGTLETWRKLQDSALEMRKNPTVAESLLWEELRRDKCGPHFRRQHVVGSFIVDFICLEKSLIIEVDGDIHDLRREHDLERTEYLSDSGFIVMRFSNNEVIAELSKVVTKIKQLVVSLPFGEGRGGDVD